MYLKNIAGCSRLFMQVLLIATFTFSVGCKKNHEKAAEAYEQYKQALAARDYDKALSFAERALGEARKAVGKGETLNGFTIGDLERAVEEARQLRFDHFTRLAEQYIREGDRKISKEFESEGPADGVAAYESYKTALGHAQHVGNTDVPATVNDRLELRPIRAGRVADQISELVAAQEEVLRLTNDVEWGDQYYQDHGRYYDYGYDSGVYSQYGWSDWYYLNKVARLENLKSRVEMLNAELGTALGYFNDSALNEKFQTATRKYLLAKQDAFQTPPDSFFSRQRKFRAEMVEAQTQLATRIGIHAGQRVDIPGTQAAAPQAPGSTSTASDDGAARRTTVASADSPEGDIHGEDLRNAND